MSAIDTLHSVADSLDAERLVGSASDIREATAKLETLLQAAEALEDWTWGSQREGPRALAEVPARALFAVHDAVRDVNRGTT